MKLNEKIFYCRKKNGMSQEKLAEQIGVSRQAISKWENGEASPEISKLISLAKVFNVTTDWLLSESDPEQDNTTKESYQYGNNNQYNSSSNNTNNNMTSNTNWTWVDSIPGVLGRLLRRFGWLFGVYQAIAGLGMIVVGSIAKYTTKRMVLGFEGMTSSMKSNMNSMITGNLGNMVGESMQDISDMSINLIKNNPVIIVGNIITIIGCVLLIVGIVLAIVLKRYSNKECN